jgi:hypothetical protein
MASNELRDRYLGVLLDRLSETGYPSSPMMDRIEAAITERSDAEEYVSRLLDTIDQERYPSPQIIERINRLIAAIESAA